MFFLHFPSTGLSQSCIHSRGVNGLAQVFFVFFQLHHSILSCLIFGLYNFIQFAYVNDFFIFCLAWIIILLNKNLF
jgi:hypothetical protein